MGQRILIVGGGLTGLALAAGLRNRNVDPVVVEQAPVITEAGWGIGLSDRHLVALDQLGITPTGPRTGGILLTRPTVLILVKPNERTSSLLTSPGVGP